MVEVHIWGGLRPALGNAPSINLEAQTIRDMFRHLSETYPGFPPHLQRGIAVSINGRIIRDNWDEELPPDAEIYLLPRIAGG